MIRTWLVWHIKSVILLYSIKNKVSLNRVSDPFVAHFVNQVSNSEHNS